MENEPLKVSQSKIKTRRLCHKKYDYRYNQKLKKKVKSVPLIIGKYFHEGIEKWCQGKSWKSPLIRMKKDIAKIEKKIFEEEFVELGYSEALELTRNMLSLYVENYEEDGYTPVEVEKEIEFEIYPGILFIGKIDLLARDPKGWLWQIEHKTAKKFPDEKIRQIDIQTVAYSKGLEIMGEEKPRGIIWDYVLKKIPSLPQQLKSGKYSTKKINTTPSALREWISSHKKELKKVGQDLSDFDSLMERAKQFGKDSFLRRVKLPISSHMEETTMKDLVHSSIEIKVLGEKLVDRNPGHHCTWCDYFSLCQAESKGLDSDYIRKHEYEVNNYGKSKKDK